MRPSEYAAQFYGARYEMKLTSLELFVESFNAPGTPRYWFCSDLTDQLYKDKLITKMQETKWRRVLLKAVWTTREGNGTLTCYKPGWIWEWLVFAAKTVKREHKT